MVTEFSLSEDLSDELENSNILYHRHVDCLHLLAIWVILSDQS